jgi:L-amino acid N-acyltransferase YncA
MKARAATPEDAPAIVLIYNQGIEDRIATFETRLRSEADVRGWFDGRHPIAIVTDNGGRPIAFAATFEYRPRDCYAGIAEFSVYVDRAARGRGAGRAAMKELLRLAEAAGFWKLLSRIFPENKASLALCRALGFREVGVYASHGQLDGEWKDVVIVERLIPRNCAR